MAKKTAFFDQLMQPNKDDDWQNLGGAKVRAGDPGVTYVKPNRVESVLNPKKQDPFEQMMKMMVLHRMIQGGSLQMPELMMMGAMPGGAKTGADITPGNLGELVGSSPDDYAARLLKQLTPDHYRSAGFGTNKQDDVAKNLIENIIPNELMARHALQVGGGKLPMGQAILDAYLREHPSPSGLGLKAILKEQLGPHLTGITNQQAAENLNSGLSGLTQSPKGGPNADELMAMIQEHMQQTQMQAPEAPPKIARHRYVSAWDHMKVAAAITPATGPVAPGSRVSSPSGFSNWAMPAIGGTAAAGLGGLGLMGAFRETADSRRAARDAAHEALQTNIHELTQNAEATPEQLSVLKGLRPKGVYDAPATSIGDHFSRAGERIGDFFGDVGHYGGGMLGKAFSSMADSPILALLGLGLGGGALWALKNKMMGGQQKPEDIARLPINKFLDEKGRFVQFSPEQFEQVVGPDPSFGRLARGLDPKTIQQMESLLKPGLMSGLKRFGGRLMGKGQQQASAQQALSNISAATGRPTTDLGELAKHFQTITGHSAENVGPALSRMLMAARAPQTGGAFTQAMGDQQGLGGMKINPQDPMSQMLMMSMLR